MAKYAGRIYRHLNETTIPPIHITNKSEYAPSRQMLTTCPICHIRFHRPPSHVARAAVSCCGRGCAAKAREVKVIVPCVSCGNNMELIPSMVGKKTTCSKKCSTLRRTKGETHAPQSFGAVRKRMDEIKKRGVCENCGTKIGPWAVRGIDAEMLSDGEVRVIDEKASLWCRHCHLVDVAPLGAPARDAKRGD